MSINEPVIDILYTNVSTLYLYINILYVQILYITST